MTRLDPHQLLFLYNNGPHQYETVIVPIRRALEDHFDGTVVAAHISQLRVTMDATAAGDTDAPGGARTGGLSVLLDGAPVRPGRVFARTFLSPYGTLVAEALEILGACVRNRPSAVRTADSKLRTAMALAAAGIPVPSQEAVVSFADRHLTGPEGTRWPRVVKKDTGFGGAGVTLAPTREQLRFELEKDEQGALFVSQEFITESAGSDLRILVADGHVLAAFTRQAAGDDFRANTALGGTVDLAHPTPAEVTLAVRAAGAVGLTYAGVDLLRSTSGPLVTEVNANPDLRTPTALCGHSVLDCVADAVANR